MARGLRWLPAAMLVGETVGNYRISALLATGGMGAVYLAEHPGIGRKAAVKVLQANLAANPEMIARFLNEARAANAIRHPGIVEIFDCGALPSGSAYIVMELLEGECLGGRLTRLSRLPLGEALDITLQTAGALGAAHAAGIVHRDLKPDNLFLIPDPRAPGHELVKVLDFGIAKLGWGLPSVSGSSTRTGTVLGTPGYMSPEQCLGRKDVDQRTDVYALGVILYQMLCGRTPFLAEAFGEMAHLHIAAPPPPPRAFNPDIPPALADALMKALAKKPADRFATTRELQAALAAARPDSVPTLRSPFTTGLVATTPPPTPRLAPRWAKLAVGGAVALALAFPLWRSARAPLPPAADVARSAAARATAPAHRPSVFPLPPRQPPTVRASAPLRVQARGLRPAVAGAKKMGAAPAGKPTVLDAGPVNPAPVHEPHPI